MQRQDVGQPVDGWTARSLARLGPTDLQARVKRRRSIQTRALVLPKKPVNLVFALETWLEGTHQH